MSVLLALLQWYAGAALALTALAGAFALAGRRLPSAGRARLAARAAQALIVLTLGAPFFAQRGAASGILRPPVQIFASAANRPAAIDLRATALDGAPGFTIPLRDVAVGAVLSALAGLLGLLLGSVPWRLAGLALRVSRMPLVRRRGGVRIVVSGDCLTAFAFAVPGRLYVVMPALLLERPAAWRMSVSHEVMHHRRGDTLTAPLLEMVRLLFFWNPAAGHAVRRVREIEEMACDEALIAKGISMPAYARCLLEAAETAARARAIRVGTTLMAGAHGRTSLERRVRMLLHQRDRGFPVLAGFIILGTALIVGVAARAGHALVERGDVSVERAREAARVASQGAVVPLDVNDLVVERLNRLVATAPGKAWMSEAMGRLPTYRALFERKADQYGVPREVMAVAVFESGLRNDLVSPPPFRATGLWQFIPATARRYGLVVQGGLDQRRVPELATDAAMRYLADLFKRFQDWRLALKAYNEGEFAVERQIKKHGTRDPWVLERASGGGYLPGAIATIIVLRSPLTARRSR